MTYFYVTHCERPIHRVLSTAQSKVQRQRWLTGTDDYNKTSPTSVVDIIYIPGMILV